MTHLHCGSGPACLLTQHSATPHFSGTAAVCSFLCSNDGHGQQEALVGRRLTVPPLTPSVSSACALMSPICAYFIALWLPDGRMQNDYITSTRLFSADTHWVLRNLMLLLVKSAKWQMPPDNKCCRFIVYYVCSFWPISHVSTVSESSNIQYCQIPRNIADTQYPIPVSS